MTNQFLTIEDVNGAIYSNQKFWFYEIDTSKIGLENNYTDVKYDFCKVTKYSNDEWLVKVDSEYFAKGAYSSSGTCIILENQDYDIFVQNVSTENVKIYIYMGIKKIDPLIPSIWFGIMGWRLRDTLVNLNLRQLKTSQPVYIVNNNNESVSSVNRTLEQGFNLIKYNDDDVGYLYVNLLKSDFQFNCNQSLILGKVNKVVLGTATDYKPNGDFIGGYTPNIRVIYKGKTLPVSYDETLTDYVFNLDLTDITDPSKIRFTVEIDANDVINSTSTEVKLQADYETINNLTGLTALINNGGIGRLGANITLTNPLTINRDVYIIGNDKTINLNSKQIIINTGRTFKAEKTSFTNGVNAIHQKNSSTVELTNCTFSGCTGTGSIIECDIELHSLDNPTDFTTKLTGCTFTNNDLCILHGGELSVENCTITGKISNPNYPYFLYQTDGSAILLRNTFNLSSNTTINTDIEFNSCIFICGETGQINGLSHTELKDNNIESFLETPQNNTSSINVTYHYSVIDDNITLQSNKGYCHTVSGEDTIYKTNITATRS